MEVVINYFLLRVKEFDGDLESQSYNWGLF